MLQNHVVSTCELLFQSSMKNTTNYLTACAGTNLTPALLANHMQTNSQAPTMNIIQKQTQKFNSQISTLFLTHTHTHTLKETNLCACAHAQRHMRTQICGDTHNLFFSFFFLHRSYFCEVYRFERGRNPLASVSSLHILWSYNNKRKKEEDFSIQTENKTYRLMQIQWCTFYTKCKGSEASLSVTCSCTSCCLKLAMGIQQSAIQLQWRSTLRLLLFMKITIHYQTYLISFTNHTDY